MLKVSQKFAGFLANGVMVAQALAALFFGYLWVTRRNQVQPVGNHATGAHQYTDDTITAYAALAVASGVLAVLQYFIRKSPRLMNLFTE